MMEIHTIYQVNIRHKKRHPLGESENPTPSITSRIGPALQARVSLGVTTISFGFQFAI